MFQVKPQVKERSKRVSSVDITRRRRPQDAADDLQRRGGFMFFEWAANVHWIEQYRCVSMMIRVCCSSKHHFLHHIFSSSSSSYSVFFFLPVPVPVLVAVLLLLFSSFLHSHCTGGRKVASGVGHARRVQDGPALARLNRSSTLLSAKDCPSRHGPWKRRT